MTAPTGFRSEWAVVRGWRVHALVTARPAAVPGAPPGAPSCAVLVPGLVTASRSMVRLARALARRGVGCAVVDLPGFGYSSRPARTLDVAEQAGVLSDWLGGSGRAGTLLVGNSYGCQVAAAAARDEPGAGLVARLALVSPTTPPAVRRALRWLPAVPAPRHRGRESADWRGRALAAVHERLGADPHLRLLNLVEYPLASLPRAAGTIRAAVARDIGPDLAGIKAPILILRGGRDRLASPGWAAALAALPPAGRLRTLPGVGHDMFWSAADRVADELLTGWPAADPQPNSTP